MTTEEVLHMVPKLVEVAVAWEGCHEGEKSKPLDQLGIVHWASDENLAFRQICRAERRFMTYGRR